MLFVQDLVSLVRYIFDIIHVFAVDVVNQFGYFGIFLLIAIENLFPPIPSEVILTFSGFLTTYTDMNIYGVIIASTLGSIVGAIILYSIGYVLNAERLANLFESKWGKLLRLKRSDVEKSERFFTKYGTKAVFFGRFIPIIRSLISIPAGSAKMNFYTFLGLTTVGSLIWNIVLIYLGKVAGDAWEIVADYVDTYTWIAVFTFAVIGILIVLIFIKVRFWDKRKESNESKDEIVENETAEE